MLALKPFILATLTAGALGAIGWPSLAEEASETFSVRVTVEGYGLVSGTDSLQHPSGSTVTLIPEPHSFWEFRRWRGSGVSGQTTAQPLVLLVDRDYDLTAIFTVKVSDTWLEDHFGTTDVDLDADPDQDGYSTRAEFANGTDPQDGAVTETALSVCRGWNAIALPLQPATGTTPATIFGTDSARLTPWWSWNAFVQAYAVAKSFSARRGYWVYASEDVPALALEGHAIVDSTLRGYAGWNLIPLATVPAEGIRDWQLGPAWAWDPVESQYDCVSGPPYDPSRAYWVYLSEDVVYANAVGNTAPTAVDDSTAADEDIETVIIDVLGNDFDPDLRDKLTVNGVNAASSKGAAVTLNTNGKLTYDATQSSTLNALAGDEWVSDTFRYVITDGNGGSASATVTVTVSGRNDTPTAEDDEASTETDQPTDIDVLANDTDPDTTDTLAIQSFDATSDEGAAITLNVDGTLTYDPTLSSTLSALGPGDSISDTFQYVVTDGNGGAASAVVTVTTTSRNETPTANDDEASTQADQPTDIDVLANDTDPDPSDTLAVQSFDATSSKGAAITLNIDGTLHYDPTASSALVVDGQSTTLDTFTYTLTDGHPGTAVTGTVHVTVDSGVTYITLEGDSISVDGSGATAEGSIVTLTSARTYWLSGTLNDGQIVVTTSDLGFVTLILDSVNITCSDSAPIYITNAEDTLISLADDTQNYLTDGNTYQVDVSGEPNAALFSKDDLDIAGGGTLVINANYNNGIGCKDDLDIFSGNITVTAVNHGIRGKDSVEIWDGTVTVSAGGDGIQSNNDEDTGKGYVMIAGGTVDITADSDGIQAETTLTVTGGDVSVVAGGGSNSGSTDAGKGLKAVTAMTLEAGTIDVDSADDAIHCDGSVTISGGDLTLATADDAVHSESSVAITGGDISIVTSYEGIDAPAITIDNATIDLVSNDDGISAVSADDDGTSSTVSIGGGTITIEAGGDGIGAEAQVLITDGTITITTAGGSSHSVSDDESAKAIKSAADLTVEGGTFTIDSADDAFHSDDSLTITGGTFTVACNDDGIHADTSIAISGGDINITKSYEGIESSEITINAGTIHVVASDDGINVASGADGSGDTGGPGWPPQGGETAGDGHLYVNGGYIAVYAVGDGVDVNGSATMTAGTLIVHGPTADNNGPLDYDGTFLMSGGFLIAVGSSGMMQTPSSSSTQESVWGTYGSAQQAGTLIHIETEGGEEILTFAPAKSYQSFVFSSPVLASGTTYVAYSGGSSSGTVEDGLYSGGTYTPGTKLGSVTL